MALAHQFIVRGMKEELLIPSEQEYIFVSDHLMRYIQDSMRWIHTSWNDQIELEGFPDEGFAVITEMEVERILEIIRPWKALFLASPENFCLTIQEDSDICYREVPVTRREVIEEMEGWIGICDLALKQHRQLVYQGL